MKVVCARCGAELPRVDGELTAFCGTCGLPRLRVSPESVVTPSAETATEAPAAPHGIRPVLDWAAALRIAAIVSVAGAVGPSLLPHAMAYGSSGGLTLLLTPLLVVITVSLYHRSRPRRDIAPKIGGRLGAVLGLMMGAWIALIAGVWGFVQRYRFHSHAMDDLFKQSAENMSQMFQSSPILPEILKQAQQPESRAGSLIFQYVIIALILVFAGTISGWMAGAILRFRRQRLVR